MVQPTSDPKILVVILLVLAALLLGMLIASC